MYALGAIAVNSVVSPLSETLGLNRAIALPIIALGIMMLSALYFGRHSYVLMLLCGMYFGSSFSASPFYSVFAAVPLLFAMHTGAKMGEDALEDFNGKTNFFTSKNGHIANALVAVAMAILVGYFLGNLGMVEIPEIEGLDSANIGIQEFLGNLSLK